jgi:hypothetical protein
VQGRAEIDIKFSEKVEPAEYEEVVKSTQSRFSCDGHIPGRGICAQREDSRQICARAKSGDEPGGEPINPIADVERVTDMELSLYFLRRQFSRLPGKPANSEEEIQ